MLKNIRILAITSFIEGLMAFIWLASIPKDEGAFSPIRLAALLGILLISLGCLAVFVRTRSGNGLVNTVEGLANNGVGIRVSFLLIAISFTAWVAILYRDQLLLVVGESGYTRMLPMAIFGALLSLQLGILFLIPRVHKDTWANIPKSVWKPTLIVLGCFLAIWAFISITRIGFIYDSVGLSWGPPGTPISFPQVNLMFALSLLLAFAFSIFGSRTLANFVSRDIVIFVVLWALAVLLWWNEPLSATHFNPPPMAPNYETYPNSDALIFDKSAYHLMYGIGFANQLVRRPLYVGMLALFHEIGGPTYEGTIFLQILLLAFIPSLTYLLTSKLSNRLAGLIAGGLILIREKNAIELSDKIITSNAKLMMSDMIAMLGLIALVYVTIHVFSKKDRNIWLLGISGVCLGLTALVRAQVLILVPLLLLFVFWYRKSFRFGIRDSAILLFGLTLVMLPWVWRNWELTGTFVLDDRGEQRLLARNYSSDPAAFPAPLPNETEQEFSARLRRDVLTYIVESPSDVAYFVSNHFLRNMATSAVYMVPLLSTDTLRGLVDKTLFWDEWKGRLTGNSALSLFATLTLVALGIGIAQEKNKLAGWFPFAAFLFYSAGNALVRSSGWRFSLPVDWVVLVYYSIALAYLPSKIKLLLDGNELVQPGAGNSHVAQGSSPEIIIFCILLLAGAAVPIAERLIPARDFSNFTGTARERLSLENALPPSEIEAFLEQENAVLYSGIALYPRYITSNSRIYLANAPAREYRYLHFWLINERDDQIIFPAKIPPQTFVHTSTVSILGCKENNYIMAWAVVLHTSPDQVLIQDVPMPSSCLLSVQK